MRRKVGRTEANNSFFPEQSSIFLGSNAGFSILAFLSVPTRLSVSLGSRQICGDRKHTEVLRSFLINAKK